MIDRLSDRPVGARTVKAKGHRVDMRVKDFIATRLSGAATRLAKRAMEIEEANPYPGYEREHHEQLPHLFVMELAASSVIVSIAAIEGIINELFTEVRGSLIQQEQRYGNVSRQAEDRWDAMWQLGIPGRGFNVIEKGKIALVLADQPPLPEDSGSVQQLATLLSLRNSLVHSEPSYQLHGRDLPLAERGTLERRLHGKFALSTMVAETDPFLWRRCLSAGCAQWAVQTEVDYINDLYAALGINSRSEIIWENVEGLWP